MSIDITPGTRVSVRPHEWQPTPGIEGQTCHDLKVVSVHDNPDDSRFAWVRAHGIDCSWPTADCTAPWCWEVLVSVDVLAAVAAGTR
ncbi:hypothetical protein GA0070616_4338 [Micromonospora nigra]|uniref:Uncharacterized protein n=1 Tax=Micromonospora nigra TaxID=145857 RepID=A0A1C6SQJ5_9ACTN|nr:hypothetical protein [Micromonospora nigra]SCL31821.1 hypothetical protein GA0070616_4338 [Micromonospora nigra]